MDIFISWSKERSKFIASALSQWLPDVIQRNVRPWMSASDIAPGERWNQKVAEQLAQSKVGIICLTPENLTAPWILFEAGAISKTYKDSFVYPYIHDLGEMELPGPLGQFQTTTADREGTRTLVRSVNSALGADGLAAEALERSFSRWWPLLNKEFKKIPTLEVERDLPLRVDVLRHTSEAFKRSARF